MGGECGDNLGDGGKVLAEMFQGWWRSNDENSGATVARNLGGRRWCQWQEGDEIRGWRRDGMGWGRAGHGTKVRMASWRARVRGHSTFQDHLLPPPPTPQREFAVVNSHHANSPFPERTRSE